MIDLNYSKEVKNAIDNNLPIVALETTIITHGGWEYPKNVELANKLENTVRDTGAIPATIGILNGKICIGMESEEIDELSSSKNVLKCSLRDLAPTLALNKCGSTTVSATLYLAKLAGISLFATGGIGGVHRGGENSMDVSADLSELGRAGGGVGVVCAGVKSILDIPRTLEYLETMGVTVASMGTDELPAFFTRSSGCKAPHRFDKIDEAAKMLYYNSRLGLESGILFTIPISESDEANGEIVENAIQSALKECDEQGIIGAEITPFVLKRVAQLTNRVSQASNVCLVNQNAKVAGEIAVALKKMI